MINLALVSLIIPTYNERENINELIERLEAIKLDLEIVIVDDNSPDKTAEEVEKLASIYNNIKVIKRRGKLGLGSAVSDGIKHASGNYIAVMDADLQHPPEKLIDLYVYLENGADIVIASRYVNGGAIEGWSVYRNLISRGAIFIAHILLPETKDINDLLSGFFAFKRESIKDLELSTRSYKVLLELLHPTRSSNIRIVEVPFVFGARKRGKSKLSSNEILRYLSLVLKLNEYRVMKYMSVGAIGTLVNEGVLYSLVERGLNPFYVSPLAIEISILTNHALNHIWTFKMRGSKKLKGYLSSLIKYHVGIALGAIINYVTLATLMPLRIHYLIANFLGIIFGFIFNYLFSEHIAWRQRAL